MFTRLPSSRVHQTILIALSLAACDGTSCGQRSFDAIVYGKDDRTEVNAVNADARGAARSVALLSTQKEMVCRGGSCVFATKPIAESFERRMCEDEPFRDQPTLGSCTGFLVGEKLLATAGHCVRTRDECADTVVIFEFEMPAAADRPYVVPAEDVYHCRKVINARDTEHGEDWSVLELDRPVKDRVPLCLRREGRPRLGKALTLIGHPYSLPKKVAAGAQVKRLDRKFFEANIDSIGGSSGSPVFSSKSFVVEGVFVRGWDGDGWSHDARGECAGSRWCSDQVGCEGEGFEEVTYASVFASMVPRVPCYTPGSPEPREPEEIDDELLNVSIIDESSTPVELPAEEGPFDVGSVDEDLTPPAESVLVDGGAVARVREHADASDDDSDDDDE